MRRANPRSAVGLFVVALLVTVTGWMTTGSSSAATANSFGPRMFGIAAGGGIQGENWKTLTNDLRAVNHAGARWLRIDINWAVIQDGGPHRYNWRPTDRVVKGATKRGIKVLGTILYTPGWARPAGTPPTHLPKPSQYAAFAAKAAKHYAALGVHAFEIWNEPNVPAFASPAPDPGTYTRMLITAYPAIKAMVPRATVLTGGTAPAVTDGTHYSPVAWLRAIYVRGGKPFFDAVAAHPYCFDNNTFPGDAESWSAWYQLYGTDPSMRSVMTDHGDRDKKIWATEFGAPTNGPGWTVSETTQAQIVTAAYRLWRGYPWAGPLFIYQGRDQGTNTSNRENFFGLERHDFSKKPAYHAYQDAVARVTGTGSTPASISRWEKAAASPAMNRAAGYRPASWP